LLQVTKADGKVDSRIATVYARIFQRLATKAFLEFQNLERRHIRGYRIKCDDPAFKIAEVKRDSVEPFLPHVSSTQKEQLSQASSEFSDMQA